MEPFTINKFVAFVLISSKKKEDAVNKAINKLNKLIINQ